MVEIANKAYPDALKDKNIVLDTPGNIPYTYNDWNTYDEETGHLNMGLNAFENYAKYRLLLTLSLSSNEILNGDPEEFLNKKWDTIKDKIYDAYYEYASSVAPGEVEDLDISKDELGKQFVKLNLAKVKYPENSAVTIPSYLKEYWETLTRLYLQQKIILNCQDKP